jgi:hypothetical protein
MAEGREAVMNAVEDLGRDVPLLEDWVLLTEAGRELGISRQRIHILAKQRRFQSLHRLGGTDSRPLFVVSRAELLAMKRSKIDV